MAAPGCVWGRGGGREVEWIGDADGAQEEKESVTVTLQLLVMTAATGRNLPTLPPPQTTRQNS
jgi:hypothetical protein